MASLANSLKAAQPIDPPTRLRLTVSASLDRIPLPGAWSHGPVYRRLDSGFLEQPLIPKAPLTPRLHIDRIDGSLRVFDSGLRPEFSDIPPTVSLPELAQPEVPPIGDHRRIWYQVVAVGVGFVAGLAAAFLFGWL